MDAWSTADDARLLRASRKAPAAYGEFCRRYIGPLHGWFASETHDPQLAADLTAEALAQALEGASRFKVRGTTSAAPWLYGIAHNLLRRYLRTQRIETAGRERLGMRIPALRASEFDEVEERVAADAFRARLGEALEALSTNEREAVRMRVVDDLSYEDVARALGCSVQAARLRVSRALRSLHVRLEGDPL